MGEKVKLYLAVMPDDGESAHIAEFEATEGPKTYRFSPKELGRHDDGYEIQRALGFSSILLKGDREDRLIGVDAVDAAHLALKSWEREAERAKKAFTNAKRNMTESAVLGLAAAGVGASNE
jgi:hypothetical protein